MSSLASKYEPVTVAAFDLFLESLGDDGALLDLIAGEIVMMTDPPGGRRRSAAPRTMDHDRGPKLDFRKSLETMRHIVVVYQDQLRIEQYRRTDDGWREPEVLIRSAETLVLDTVEVSTPRADTYFDVSFEKW